MPRKNPDDPATARPPRDEMIQQLQGHHEMRYDPATARPPAEIANSAKIANPAIPSPLIAPG